MTNWKALRLRRNSETEYQAQIDMEQRLKFRGSEVHFRDLGFRNVSQFTSEAEFGRFVLRLCSGLDDDNNDWDLRLAALQIIEKAAAESMDPKNIAIREFARKVFVNKKVVAALAFALEEQISVERPVIVKQCSLTVQSLAVALKLRFQKVAEQIFPTFLRGMGRPNLMIRRHIDGAITEMIQNVQDKSLLIVLFEEYRNDSKHDIDPRDYLYNETHSHMRFSSQENTLFFQNCCRYFQLMLKEWSIDTMVDEGDLNNIGQFMRECLSMPDETCRHITAKSFWIFVGYFPERKEPFLMTLPPRLRTVVVKVEYEDTKRRKQCSSTNSESFS